MHRTLRVSPRTAATCGAGAPLTRREFLLSTAAVLAASTAAHSAALPAQAAPPPSVPPHLAGYESVFASSPRAASMRWLTDAKFGLFVHYTLASLLAGGKQEFVKGADPQALFRRFTAEKFDAGIIADLAVAARMKYVTFTTKHLGNLYMYRTSVSDFTSLNSPAKRDLVAELAEACRRRGLGLFFYVPPETARTDADHLARNHATLRELLTQYGPVAGIWFDGIGPYYKDPPLYSRLSETYALVRSIQPQALVSFKTGATGEEDFLAPEHTPQLHYDRHHADAKKFEGKLIEVCTTMQTGTAMWINNDSARHMDADQVMAKLAELRRQGCNLLLNTGPRADGSVHPADATALREVGARLRKSGWPGAASPPAK